ncbi:MAG: formate/nitrite transporter family protein [Eubacteriales bacterium]
MGKSTLSPAEIYQTWVDTGEKKGNLPVGKMLFLGILAGLFIGFGAHADIIIMQTLGETVDVGLAKFLGAAVFPVGLMLVILAGAELFTGNNLMTLAVVSKKITMTQMMLNWVVVYIGNFIGSILLAGILVKSGLYNGEAVSTMAVGIATGKVGITVSQGILRAILCNVIVVLACWMQAGSKDMVGKIFIIWFPIMLFVLSGYEHSIANMFFIPLGKFLGANITWAQIWLNNLIPVTIGNIIGGAIIIPFIYHYIYSAKKDAPVDENYAVKKTSVIESN